MPSKKNLTIEVAFSEPPSGDLSPGLIKGGISITVGETELTRSNEETNEPVEWYDNNGTKFTAGDRQFHGDYLLQTISQLLRALRTVHEADGRYDEQIVNVPYGKVLVISYLDEETVRLAFQERHPNNPSHPVPLEVALGVPVTLRALTEASIEAADNYLEYASQCYDVSQADSISDLRGDLEELRNSVAFMNDEEYS